MNAPVTREHRELAVLTMYPDCQPNSYMWVEFVLSENSAPYRTLARVAQALADAATPARAVKALNDKIISLASRKPSPSGEHTWSVTYYANHCTVRLNGELLAYESDCDRAISIAAEKASAL